ncbi:MAG: hypothetical protein SGJ11_06785 [Phycisphaerae bacterium]|nr:hypothetical protein [Phycisphaerae bacterium]
MRCCTFTTCVVAAALAAVSAVPASPLLAQSGVSTPENPKPATALPPPLTPPPLGSPKEPDIASCVNGYIAAREWVSALAAPDPSATEAKWPLPGVRGICAILRHEGRIVGVGEDWRSVGDDQMLRRAMARAIGAALGDEVIRGLDPAVRDAAGARLTLELECAGRPEPLLGRTLDECAQRIERGLDGIALRRGQAGNVSWHVAFPGRTLASNTARNPLGTLERLVREAGLPARDLPELGRIEPVGVFRFETLRLAQLRPDQSPSVRGRGIVRVSDADVTPTSVHDHAMATLRRFIRSLPPRDGADGLPAGTGLFGNYIPTKDLYDPVVAPAADQAFAAWGAAAIAASSSFTAAEREEARDFARRLLEDLTVVGPLESQPMVAVPAMAGVVCALELLGNDPEISAAVQDAGAIAREKLEDRLNRGNPGERPMSAMAAALALGTERRLASASDVRVGLDAAWSSAEPNQLISHLAWLVIAEIAYTRATGEPLAHADTARGIANLLFAAQSGFSDRAAEHDLRGGFRLTGERSAGVTSQSLRPGLALASILSFPGSVPENELPQYRERLIALLRFSQELTIAADFAGFYRNPSRVEGGVREALWDSEQFTLANAMSILVDVAALDADPWGLAGHKRPAETAIAPEGAPAGNGPPPASPESVAKPPA